MNIYTDKCPHCGTYISIREATRCPGCSSSIYRYAFYYYPSLEAVEAAEEAAAADLAYWNSEAGKEHNKRIEENNQKKSEQQDQIQARNGMFDLLSTIGLLSLISIPFVWMFGGYLWPHFGYYGWPSLGAGIISALYQSLKDS